MDLSSFSNDELLKLRDIKKGSVNLSSLSNDELLKLRSAKIGQTTQNQEAIELPKTTQNQQTIQLPKITQEQLKAWQEQDKPIQPIVFPFSEPLLNRLSGLFGTRTNADDELKNAKTTEQQVSAINNILSKKAASKPIFSDNTSDKEQALKDISDKLYTQNGSRIVQKGNEYFIKDKDGKYTNIDDGILNSIGRIARDNIASVIGTMIGARNGSIIKGAIGAGAGGAIDMKTASNYMGQSTVNPKELAQRMGEEALLSLGGDMAIKALTSKPAINTLKGTAKTALNIADKGLAGVGARHILSQNIGGATSALKANLGGDHEFRNALDSAKDALGADLDNFVRKDIKTIDKTSDKKYIQKGIDIANSAINRVNETLKGLNVGKADAELLLSALGHENGVKNILDSVANNPQSAQKITEISSNLNKSFSDSINEQLAKFETQTPKDSFKNSFNQVKKDYADTKDFLVKNSNYQSDFKELSENLATILSDTQNINTRGVFNALNGGGNLENLLNAKNAINEQLGYIMKADFKSSSDFINQKALNEAKSLIDNEINTALKNDENLINLYKSANGDYATMKNIVDSNLMNQISRDGKTSLEALNAMIKSNENINGVTLNDFLSSLGAKDRAIAEANIIKGLMDKNSVNGVVDFRALNQSLNSLDFGSEFAKELKSQILNRQALLNNTSDILNALGSKVVKSKSMSQGISTDPLKRAETMKANFVVDKLKPLIPRLGNNEALKLHLNRAILNANGDFKLAIKNIDNIPDGNLPTPTRNLLNEFKEAVKEIEKQVVKADNQPNLANQANSGNIDSLTQQMTYLQNALKGDGFVTYPNSAKQIYPHNAIFEVPNEIRQIADIGDRVSASLEWLRSNHPEMFKTQRAVKEVIDYVLKEPENIVSPKKGDGVILSKQNDKKMDEIGINQNSEVFHANKRKLNSNEKQAVSGDALPPHLDADNISLTGRYSVGGKPHLTAVDENIIPQNAKNEVKEQAKSTQINEQRAKAKSEPTATTAKDLTADAPSELYKAHRKAQKAKEAPKSQEPTTQAEPTPQAKQETQATKEADIKADKKAKLDEEFAKNKAYVEGLEREAINKIEALHNLSKTKAERIPLKSIISQAEQELKEFARLRAKETGASQERINNVKIKSLDDLKNHLDSLGLYIAKTKDKEGEALLNKYVEILNDISEARLNQRAIKKQNETQKDDLIKGVVDSLKGLQIVGLRNLSNFLTKYGKTDEFMTKANPKWKSEFDKARALMERDQNITPIKEFGTNYAEFYRDGQNAIKKLLTERQGQVAGAFHKDGRDITISWGEAKIANGDIKGYGLSKIEAKHLNDFEIFKGDTPQEKMANGINEIIEKGKIVSDSGIDTIWYKKGDSYFLVGLSKGFKGIGDNSWVVTSYKKTNISENKKAEINEVLNGSGNSKTLSAYAEIKSSKTPELTTAENSTPKTTKSQAQVEQQAKQYAKWLSQADKIPPQAPDELYKAYDKAKRT